jgi:hypothetical protein
MYAMQYEIPLPADYEMAIIRHRVASRGHATDAYPDLGLKAYLVRERGVAGATANAYAPFYLWLDAAGMNRFLWSGTGFSAIVESFGRPPVRPFIGADFRLGPAHDAAPRWATWASAAIPAGQAPTASVPAAIEALPALAERATLHAAAVVVDPQRWEIVTFALWQTEPDAEAGAIWQVLHLSQPGLAELDAWARRRRAADGRD